MSCSRKSLAVGYTHLARRFHPSFSHLVRDDRENSESQRSFPFSLAAAPLPRSPSSSQSFDRFRSPVRDWRITGFYFPVVIHQSLRNYSSSSEVSEESGYIDDVANVLSGTTMDSTAAPFPGEVSAAAADSFVPVAALQHVIDAVHSFTGLNWWASIALTTVLIRAATVPLLINQLKAAAKLNIMRPEMEKIKQELDNNKDPESLREGQQRMKELFIKHGVTPFTPLKGALIQGPIFISFFFAISNMVEKVPSFKGGGIYWFTDLTTPDSMYILPILTSLTFLATVELNMQEGMEGNNMAKTMKNFSRVLGLLTIPFTANFPKAIFFYWVTSNLFSLLYGYVIKRPGIRKLLDLPEPISNLELASQPNFSFFGTSKPVPPTVPSTPVDGPPAPDSVKYTEQRRISPSSIINQRIKVLEKAVKARNKSHKR